MLASSNLSITPTQAIILGVIEGLTEFLPVSSTGHMILVSSIMGIQEDAFVKAFEVIIQLGAILSVLLLYWKRFLPNFSFYSKLMVAFLPAAIIGLAVKKKIDLILGSPVIVAWSLLIGGVILFFVDTYFKSEKNEKTCQDLTIKNSFTLGLIQCLAFIPGVSRSAATIIGGLSLGLKKTEASEFSFFLAVPTLAGASVVKLHSSLKVIQSDQWGILLLGSGIAFIVAALSIKAFMYFAQRFGFRIFGIYRIILGTFILFYFR